MYVSMYVSMYVMYVRMGVLKVGVIRISFQGSLIMACHYMNVISQRFTSSPIAIHFPELYLAVYTSLLSARHWKPTCQVPLLFANTPLLLTEHLLVLTTPQNKDPGDRGGLSIAPLRAVYL